MTTDPNWGIDHVPDNVNSGNVVANDAIDEIVQGVSDPFTVDLTSGDVTLTTPEYALNFAFACSGHSVARVLTLPAVKKFALIENEGTGTGAITVTVGSGTVVVPIGDKALIYTDGGTNDITLIGLSSVAGSSGLAGVSSVATTSSTPALEDANTWIRYTSALGCAVTLPNDSSVAFAIGTVIYHEQSTTGAVTFVDDGTSAVIVPATFNAVSAEQYAVVATVKVASNLWLLCGYLSGASA